MFILHNNVSISINLEDVFNPGRQGIRVLMLDFEIKLLDSILCYY